MSIGIVALLFEDKRVVTLNGVSVSNYAALMQLLSATSLRPTSSVLFSPTNILNQCGVEL